MERYVEEFLKLSYQVSWHDAALCACFQLGLNEETIRYELPACGFPLVELINLILYLNGFTFEVEVKKNENHPHPETHLASPAHPTLGPSTFLTNVSDHPLPSIYPRARRWTSNSADLGAKMVDPAYQSVRSVLKSASLFQSSVPSSFSVLSPETPATESGLPAAPLSSPPADLLSSPMMTAAISLTSAQKRRMKRKRLLALAPDQSQEMALAPDQSRESTPECSLESAP